MKTAETRFDVPPNVAAREVDGDMVLLDLESGTYFGLEPIGARIWELLESGATVSAIHGELVAEYDVEPAELERDILELVTELQKANLIEAMS